MRLDIPSRQLDETLLWLCGIPSPLGEERALCDAVYERLERLPCGGPIRRYGQSLVVPVTRGRGPRIGLVGHLDTVRTECGPARMEAGRCFGAGAADMKSGLAIMIVLAEALALDELRCDLTLAFYAREEGPFADNELGVVLDADPELPKVDFAVCLEPSDNGLELGCLGSLHAKVTFEGRSAHSARPWEGESAIDKAVSLLDELRRVPPEEAQFEGITYRGVTTVTQACDGGRGKNVVPDRFILNVNHRFPPDRTTDQAKEHVLRLVDGRAAVEFVESAPPAAPNAAHPFVRGLVASGARAVRPKQAWTDIARFSALGVAAINLGPGESAQAHQTNESTSLARLYEGYSIFARWLASVAPQSWP